MTKPRSSKRSSGSYAKPRKRKPTLLLDSSIASKLLAGALRDMGFNVLLHIARFPEGTPDRKWLSVAGARRWFVLTRDKRIRHHPYERAAVMAAGVGLFVLAAAKDLGADGWIETMRHAKRRILETMQTTPRPFIAHISADGSLRLVMEEKGEARR